MEHKKVFIFDVQLNGKGVGLVTLEFKCDFLVKTTVGKKFTFTANDSEDHGVGIALIYSPLTHKTEHSCPVDFYSLWELTHPNRKSSTLAAKNGATIYYRGPLFVH